MRKHPSSSITAIRSAGRVFHAPDAKRRGQKTNTRTYSEEWQIAAHIGGKSGNEPKTTIPEDFARKLSKQFISDHLLLCSGQLCFRTGALSHRGGRHKPSTRMGNPPEPTALVLAVVVCNTAESERERENA